MNVIQQEALAKAVGMERNELIASVKEREVLAKLGGESLETQLKEAKTQAAEIIEAAKKRDAKIVEEAAVKAQAEKEKILAAGYAEIETERNQAREELRQQVAVLAVAGAEKILERSIDAAAHSDILDKLVAEL